ncbi:cupin domain-containing protein [Methylacidiphilum caldifontis]|uniref:cupin domain-containing protein n=1 Tax=Methylacidiphilum caldifontis TaxID=2795386 RepID=UPI001A8CBC48|nr:cupin domain-containing protein [Methylacidiphilum caldifontis]QSR89230.1 cupin domain-containing protein [Methylacidiphilum caldifontis]
MNTLSSKAIIIEKNPSQNKLDELGVARWPIWEKEPSSFDWSYDQKECCYILEGEALIQVGEEKPLRISQGELVTFPAGLSCHWVITKKIRKHYQLG